MMSYHIVVHKRVATYLQRLPEAQRERLKAAIRLLEHDPTHAPHVKPMLGEWLGYCRGRLASYLLGKYSNNLCRLHRFKR